MSHTGSHSNEPYDDGQPTQAYHYRDSDGTDSSTSAFDQSSNKSKFDWSQASGGNAPTDELEAVQEPSDRTRVMPAAQFDQHAQHGQQQDAPTAVYTPVPEEQRASTSRPAPAFEQVTYQQEPQYVPPRGAGAGAGAGFASSGYAPQGQGGQQPAFMPHPGDLRKGASAGGRVASLLINLVLTALLFLVLWDYREVPTLNSVIMKWFMDVPMTTLLFISVIPIIVGAIGLLSGLTLWLSATGTGVFGVLIFVFSVVSASLQPSLAGVFGIFLSYALPILFPLSLLMMGAALGAGLARRAGARRMMRAYTGRL